MSNFCQDCNSETIMCQACGKELCATEANFKWFDEFLNYDNTLRKGNVCERCRAIMGGSGIASLITYHHRPMVMVEVE